MPGDYFHTPTDLNVHPQRRETRGGNFLTRLLAVYRRYAENRPNCRLHSNAFLAQIL